MPKRFGWLATALILAIVFGALAIQVNAGQEQKSGYRVLSPIASGNLVIFPVVASSENNTGMFITLDEGIRSGDVVVTESGGVQPLVRGRRHVPFPSAGAQVNNLVLINNSKR